MKSKDMLSLIAAVAILLVAGYIGYTQLIAKKSSSAQSVKVEIVGEIKPDFDTTTLSDLSDNTKTHDYTVPFDLNTGLSNQNVFGR